jgi:RimJ/RimL family protein N-acetyltransferase
MLDATNAPSLRVAEKCGYRELARVTYKTWPTLLYRR